jgi:hypothetical protein
MLMDTNNFLKLARDLKVISTDSVFIKSSLNKLLEGKQLPIKIEKIMNITINEIVKYNTGVKND